MVPLGLLNAPQFVFGTVGLLACPLMRRPFSSQITHCRITLFDDRAVAILITRMLDALAGLIGAEQLGNAAQNGGDRKENRDDRDDPRVMLRQERRDGRPDLIEAHVIGAPRWRG
ncbi:hypothetical protein KGY14_09815 [Ameyamaea chiangmaiensis]|uniref:Uncharacterized protein n=1 Tax=Ameyamaea chiangmaiensis TaxID=442969 RepID=A0A850PAP3_9PROT|nr:hypothetical protein [Ameyamaea chiangmaiensis]MBS4075486.1 hypothetical protein [Ameyamaea chiangmaiensis]NVN38982.1 hypothetical protein [Ameyamaea chiangmaiensis]